MIKTSMAAIALGQLDHGATPLTMAAAYGVFGNSGKYTTARLYTKVVDRTGKIILQTTVKNTEVLTPQSAFIMYDLLKGPVSANGTGPQANFGNMEVRGKTGTSSDMKNLWFCGLTPYYSASVWIGDDDSTTVNGIYSTTAASLWGSIMSSAHANLATKTLQQPTGIVSASVCLDSGKIPTDLCAEDPRGNRVYTEIFAAGTVPTATCNIHAAIRVNKLTGTLATQYTPSFLIGTKVFIKRAYAPSVYLADEPYTVPSIYDDTPAKTAPQPTPTPTPTPTPNTTTTPGDTTTTPGDTITPTQ